MHYGDCNYIMVHDGVRPLVSAKVISDALAAAQKAGTAVPCIHPSNSYRMVEGGANRALDRSKLRAIQTPQVFRADILRSAYSAGYREEFTDDASVVEAAGHAITLCEGDPCNIKITTPADLTIAALLLERSQE